MGGLTNQFINIFEEKLGAKLKKCAKSIMDYPYMYYGLTKVIALLPGCYIFKFIAGNQLWTGDFDG